jgi:hypothetical protein
MVHGCAHLNLVLRGAELVMRKNNGARVCALKFGVARSKVVNAWKNNSVWMCALNLACAWCRLVCMHNGVRMCTLNLHCCVWWRMHNIGVCVCACIILACVVYWQSAEEFCWCACNVGMQCMHVEYSCRANGLINGVRGVLVHGGSVLNFGMVCNSVECNVRGILACDTKIVCNRY